MTNNALSYWHKQSSDQLLYPDIEWSKPERRDQAGKLAIIGGNALGFTAVAESYDTAQRTGAGEIKILLPENIKKAIPPTLTDVTFGTTNASGSLSKEALPAMTTLAQWSDVTLMIGDAGRSSETAVTYEQFLLDYTGPLVLTRDAIDLIKNSPRTLVERPDTLLVMAFAQLQKLFQSVYYPKVLTFSMQLTNLIEAMHKFTTTYPVSLSVLHRDHLVIASAGQIVTTEWKHSPMTIWRGQTATKMAVYWMWNPSKVLEASASSLIDNK